MARSWKEDFFEKLVEASHAAGEARLATATLHRRKKTASYRHPQLQWLECVFDSNRISGSRDSQVLVVECAAKRGTEVDGPALSAADVKYWGHWVLEIARREIGRFYPPDPEGSVPVAYLWARTVKCPNPACGGRIPLLLQKWLCRKPGRNVALKVIPRSETMTCDFEIVENRSIDFDASQGTIKRGQTECPFCRNTADAAYLRAQAKKGLLGEQLTTVVAVRKGTSGKSYRKATALDTSYFQAAKVVLGEHLAASGDGLVPTEEISKRQPRIMWVTNYGLTEWRHIYNHRQVLALSTLCRLVRQVYSILEEGLDADYARAIASLMGLAVGRFADFNSTLCVFNNVGGRGVKNTFGRQALPLVWDYAESMPFNPQGANWAACIEAAIKSIRNISMSDVASVMRGSATSIPANDETFEAVITDPPYYDAVPYSDLSDFFYVWHKRALSNVLPSEFRTPVPPKRLEIIEERPHKSLTHRKDRRFYEENMTLGFAEVRGVLRRGGVACVMFAHKSTTAWETLIGSLLRAGLIVTSSWPLHTERPGRLLSIGTASLASSVTLVCRKRTSSLGDGLWDDVRQHLKPVARERLDFFWSQGVRGADFFISAIGPALSVFGKYERVTKLTGEEVTVGQFLDEVRGLVTTYAPNKIMKTTHTATIDPESRFYVIWKWSYGEAKVPADESFKLAQALGMDTEIMWDRTGVLEKLGENVLAVPVAKRMKIKDLGEPNGDGSPASLIDVLYRFCVFRDNGDSEGMAEFLGRSGQGRNHNLWMVAQAVSEILPDGDKEKQLMQALLNQRDQLEKAQARLF